MVLDILMTLGSPPIIGMCLLVGVLGGLYYLRAPLELVVLIMVAFSMTIAGFFLEGLVPLIAIACGVVIGMMFLRLVRR